MEIGSEFWLENLKTDCNIDKTLEKNNRLLLLSGRTSIDYAINLIEKCRKINTVYVPSYCCESMLLPFVERKINLEFYTVLFDGEKIVCNVDYNKKCDVFLAMHYFGFSDNKTDKYINAFREKNVYVIEDSTHSLLSARPYNQNSDFVISSLRKWFPVISGGLLIVNNNNFLEDFNLLKKQLKDNLEYSQIKEKAMIEKGKYINDELDVNKIKFLQKFKKAESILDINYKFYKIDEISYKVLMNIDVQKVILQRKKNVEIIYNYLVNQTKIQYIKEINLDENCPLFVPIFLEYKMRDNLKKYLIDNGIYCPNHWSIPKQISKDYQKAIYNKELSLICDQRYNQIDISKYIDLIKHKEL